MEVTITRYFYSDVQTRGILSVYDEGQVFQCKTLELPWKGNENRVSCIPPGPNTGPKEYRLEHRSAAQSGNFNYPHFIVKGVPGRSYILIHRGNFYTQILGCVLVGREFIDINADGHPDVTSSKETLSDLRSTLSPSVPFSVESAEERAGEIGPVPTAEPEPVDLPDLSVPSEIDAPPST